jgi:hypothetical protein
LFDKMVRGVQRNTKLQHPRPDVSGYEVKIESTAFKPVVERITRGLYWHFYHETLPLETSMKISRLRIGEWLPEFVSDMTRFGVGGDQFYCAYNRMDDHPTVSLWVFVFHRRLLAMVMTDVAVSDRLIIEAAGPAAADIAQG